MARFWKHASQTVRPRSVPKVPWLICLLVFSLSATVVYRWGQGSWIRASAKPTYTATAYVVQRSHQMAGDGREMTDPSDGSPHYAADGEIRIPMAFTDDDPRRAEEVANALAERYVHDRRAEWKQSADRPLQDAREAVEKARDEYAQSQVRLDEFQRQLAETVEKTRAAAKRTAVSERPTNDNPRWLDLNRQLSELEQRRGRLLVDRTPMHPAVQDISERIGDLKHQMAAISPTLPSPVTGKGADIGLPSPSGRGAGGEGGQGLEPAHSDMPLAEQDQQKLSKLTAAVESARRALDQAETAEEQAQQIQKAEPRYSVVYAQAIEIVMLSDYRGQRVLWTTMTAAALMAFGVGSVLVGAKVEPPVVSAAQVQAHAGATVVGTIPAACSASNPQALARRQSRLRTILVLIGLILIAAGPLAALCGIAGV